MIVNSINSAQTLRSQSFSSQEAPVSKEQKPAFGMREDSYESSGKQVAKRLITEGTVGAIIGLGFGLLNKCRGKGLLRVAGANAAFLIVFSELWNIVAKPVNKLVDKF